VSHDPSEIVLICRFAAQETFLIITNVVNNSYFYGNCGTFLKDFFFINRKFQEQNLFEIETFYNIIMVFTDTFDQLNTYLLIV